MQEGTKKLISDIVEKIVSEYKPQRIILFGSYAYGTPSEESDLDIFIIKDTDSPPPDRWMEVRKILRPLNRFIPISPLIYTTCEIEERRKVRDFFIEDILEKGKVLYG